MTKPHINVKTLGFTPAVTRTITLLACVKVVKLSRDVIDAQLVEAEGEVP